MKRIHRALLLVALGCVHCRKDVEGERAAPALSATKPWRQVRTFADRLAAIEKDATRTPADTDVPCPDDDIRQTLGQGGGRLLVAEREYLGRYGSPSGPAAHEKRDVRWDFLTTQALRALRFPVELESPKAAIDVAYRVKELNDDYEYLAVIVPKERTPPRLEGEGFHAGTFNGAVFVYDLSSGKRLCQAVFSAASDESVAFRDPERKEEALWQEFTLRIRQALNDAVGRITRHLNLDM